MQINRKNILLATLNSTYQHAAFGLRYIYANMGPLQFSTEIMEFTISQDVRIIAESIIGKKPLVLGLGVYIWNTRQTLDLARLLKKINPELVIVLGGPEVSFETETQELTCVVDYVIKGEGDFLFFEFCKNFFAGNLPGSKILSGPLPDLQKLSSPYELYSENDIKNRVLYVEASRGCPYKCEYCLSSLDKSVRNFPLEKFLSDMQSLINRGAKQFKFVDRTFNLSPQISSKILEFFLAQSHQDLFLHFEMVPDRLPDEIKQLIEKFPPGALQFEVGIQTWNTGVAKNVSRRQDYGKIVENFKFLQERTKVHTHADLIVGLPGETLESFGQGFDKLWACGPHEIQVGLLKRLKGTPIVRHDQEFLMRYQEHPPFQILSTRDMDYPTIQKMVRFAKFWDLYANSGEFKNLILFLNNDAAVNGRSFFWAFMGFTEFLAARHTEGHGIALLRLVESAWIYLTQRLNVTESTAREILAQDYSGKIKRDLPNYLKAEKKEAGVLPASTRSQLKRQFRHQLT